MDGFYVFQTIRSVLNWHILRISSGTGKAWNMPEYQNMKRLLYPVYSRNCLSISDYGLGRRLPRILRMNSDKKRSNPLTDDESISVTAHVITNINFFTVQHEVVIMFITYLYTFVNNGIIVSKSPLSVNFHNFRYFQTTIRKLFPKLKCHYW